MGKSESASTTELAGPPSVPGREGKGWVSATLPVRDVSPEAFLRWAQGKPRGFWARKGRWIVHAGQVVSFRFPGAEGEETPGEGTEVEASRFSRVWKAGESVRQLILESVSSGDASSSPRLFGGFSFAEDHASAGIWHAFPSACFVLPEIELLVGKEGGSLTLRGPRLPSEDLPSASRRLGKELEELRARLEAPRSFAGRTRPWDASRIVLEPGPGVWGRMVDDALGAIGERELAKVVMARALEAFFPPGRAPDPVDVALTLWRENPSSHVFLFEPEPGRILVGAAPETVATVSGGSFRATAVAGSISSVEDPVKQEALGRELLGSEKDLREHRFCVEDMVARLGPVATDVEADPEPRLLTLSSIQHLETAITGIMRGGKTVMDALEALHPTPAVCGYPRDRALDFLLGREPVRRGWYAGPVGWFDGNGDGVFVPALRSAVAAGNRWRLYSGAGIVQGSRSDREWEETRIKFQPMLRALKAPSHGLSPVERDVAGGSQETGS